MAVTRPVIQQRIPFVDAQGRLSNEGLRALNDALGSIFDQISQILELYGITDAISVDLVGISAAPVLLRSASGSFPNGRVIQAGAAIGFADSPSTLTIAFDGDTDDVPEGLNLYFTIARARSTVAGSSTVSYDLPTGVFSLTSDNVIAALGFTPAPASSALSLGIRTITTTPTITASDHTLLCDATGAAIPIALPAASTLSGRVLAFKKIDATANTVTLAADGVDLIDGAATLAITGQYDSYTIQSNGAGWWVL